jgi:hypothetical protein
VQPGGACILGFRSATLRVRVSIERGRPYDADAWVRQTITDLGLEQTVRPEGRPRLHLFFLRLEARYNPCCNASILFLDANVPGASFQLNAYSPAGSTAPTASTNVWQQYAIYLDGNNILNGIVCIWGTNTQVPLINFGPIFLAQLQQPKIPAGYNLQILLSFDTNAPFNVVGATFVVVNKNTGITLQNMPMRLNMLYRYNISPQTRVTEAYMAPIVSFELDFVGPANGEKAVFSSGSGMIEYQAMNALMTSNDNPGNVALRSISTQENANTTYDVLPGTPSTLIKQGFNIIGTYL